MNEPPELTSAEQLDKGFRALRFSPDLEARFLSFCNDRYLGRLRFAALVAVGIFAFFSVYNYLQLPEPIGLFAAAVALLFICPLLTLMWWATYIPRFQKNTVPLFLVALVIAVGGLLTIMYTAHVHDVRYRFDGLMLITMYIYFLSGMRFRLAAGVSLLVTVIYLIGESFTPFPGYQLMENGVYLLSANIIGMVGCYSLEHALRESFLNTLELEDHAQRDGLTGIPNRRYLESEMQRLWKQAQRENKSVAVAFVDIDFFKSYNDTHGHLAGDDCLKTVAQTLARQARRPLDVTARYGGEEFVIFWYDLIEPYDLFALADQAREAVQERAIPHRGESIGGVVTVSVGYAEFVPTQWASFESLLEKADQAMYAAKQSGRNKTVGFTEDMKPSEAQEQNT